MAPVITLTTDFGGAGAYVGVMKAVIARYAPEARVMDLTHEVAAGRAAEAGFWLARSYAYFPAGSVHVTVVDPGVGTDRAILACAFDGHLFLAPDNGILPVVTGGRAPLYALSPGWAAGRGWPTPSRTFHGRDLFAPLAAALITGEARPEGIGPEARDPVPAALRPAGRRAGMVRGEVIAVDHWGNLITNVEADDIAGMADPRVQVGGRELKLVGTYGEAPPGGLVALLNSFGVLEVAWRDGSAARLLGLGHGAAVNVGPRRDADGA